ncbi:hypothetical protein HN588_13855 [Candidatus Bathyarchaeota archaeon]|jgi:hypothetical protein|nr:hypothetical protein [Candidatus Bathyarchaeota archaeon]
MAKENKEEVVVEEKTTPEEEYKKLISAVMANNKQLQALQQQNVMVEGALLTLEKLHGFDRQEVAKELNDTNV